MRNLPVKLNSGNDDLNELLRYNQVTLAFVERISAAFKFSSLRILSNRDYWSDIPRTWTGVGIGVQTSCASDGRIFFLNRAPPHVYIFAA